MYLSYGRENGLFSNILTQSRLTILCKVIGTTGLLSNSSAIFAISAIMGFAMSYSASNTASAVITCPLAATLAMGAGLNPIPSIIAAALASSISSSIPSTTSPMAIIYSSRVVRISSMFKTGMVSDLIRLAILIIVGPILIGLVYK
jgi:solute carrier family 13 (sodium-dependent dicarboxylate transporter), member 2/3/5